MQPKVVPGGAWTLLGTQPPGRDDPGWVYDSRADRFIVFGGAVSSNTYTNSTWAYDYPSGTWTNITPVVGPTPRVGAGMVYDSRADRIILFGGGTAPFPAVLNDTWVFDYTNRTWTNATSSAEPGGRVGAAMSYDALADRTILFGGGSSGGLVGDTWTYDFETSIWSPRRPIGSPSARFFGSMVYDQSAHMSLLFGGTTKSGLSLVTSNDLYGYDFTADAWTHLMPATSPPRRGGAAMAYDVTAAHVVLFGGATGLTLASARNDTWEYSSASNSWANLTPIHSPSRRVDSGMAFDPRVDRFVLFGGSLSSPQDEVWSYEFGARQPDAPRNLMAAGGTSKVTLTWQVPDSDGGSTITNYSIYRGTTSGGETFVTTTAGPVLTYTDTAVATGTTYYYEVTPANSIGEGPRSNQASATPVAPDTTLELVIVLIVVAAAVAVVALLLMRRRRKLAQAAVAKAQPPPPPPSPPSPPPGAP